jgi:hypothetical protein
MSNISKNCNTFCWWRINIFLEKIFATRSRRHKEKRNIRLYGLSFSLLSSLREDGCHAEFISASLSNEKIPKRFAAANGMITRICVCHADGYQLLYAVGEILTSVRMTARVAMCHADEYQHLYAMKVRNSDIHLNNRLCLIFVPWSLRGKNKY